jgi:hypothetical protein
MTVKYVIKAGSSIKAIKQNLRWSNYANLDNPKRSYISWDIKQHNMY